MTDTAYPNQDNPFFQGWVLRTSEVIQALNAQYARTCGHIDGDTLLNAAKRFQSFHHRWGHGLYGRREPFAGFTFELEEGKRLAIEFPHFSYDGECANGVCGDIVVCTEGEVSDEELDVWASNFARLLPDMRPAPAPLPDESFFANG
jgi:hypothetical protein